MMIWLVADLFLTCCVMFYVMRETAYQRELSGPCYRCGERGFRDKGSRVGECLKCGAWTNFSWTAYDS